MIWSWSVNKFVKAKISREGIFANVKIFFYGVIVFQDQFVFTGPVPQFLFTGLGLKFLFKGTAPKFLFTCPGLKFHYQFRTWVCIYRPSPSSPQFVFTGPGLWCVLPGRAWICICHIIGSSSCGSSNIISSSNFCEMENTNISMSIFVN